jgi:hypothetical protein
MLLAAGRESWPPACLTLARPGIVAVSRQDRVEVGADLMAKAQSRWPVEGAIEGEPTMAHFERARSLPHGSTSAVTSNRR